MAVMELSLETEGLIQRFLREPKVKCLNSSNSTSVPEPFEGSSGGRAGGILTRRSSLMNCDSCECVREQ